MIAAKLANIKHGEVGGGHEKSDTHMCMSDAAKLLNVGVTSVSYAKKVLAEGTPEEIEGVKLGLVAVKPLAKQILRDAAPPAALKKLALPAEGTRRRQDILAARKRRVVTVLQSIAAGTNGQRPMRPRSHGFCPTRGRRRARPSDPARPAFGRSRVCANISR
jgi:hypothetical protein